MENEPRYGFLHANRETLAQALEVVRRQVCCYNPAAYTGDYSQDPLCDCKYGANIDEIVAEGKRYVGERTGCPELRSVIYMLLHGEPTIQDSIDPEFFIAG